MSASTAGLEVRTGSRRLREFVELLSSMRFAIALLTLICIASVIGTVVQQHQPAVNYVNQFGPFWAEVFRRMGLFAVYSTGWFLVILAFLVTSTSLCIARHVPKILAEVRTYKEGVRESSLKAFHHKAEGALALTREAAIAHVSQALAAGGWRAKAQVRENGVMVAARQGMANRLGYLAAHGAIVLVCLGGLLDGDLIVKLQMALAGKTPFTGSGSIAAVPAQHRLSPNNPTFRGNLFVPEGATAGTAVINMPDGVVLQDLPFGVELKKFVVEYYDTGMPKLFASDIVIHDTDGTRTEAKIKVNEPFVYNGVTLYQSSFDDGGSKLTVLARPFGRSGQPLEIRSEVGASTVLKPAPVAGAASGVGAPLSLEFTELRVINVENLGGDESETDVRAVNLATTLDKHLGSGAQKPGEKKLHNVGPSFKYRLRDPAGQAREFHNYMLPVDLDGQKVFLAGVRETLDQGFRYLRIPADDQGEVEGWLALRAALADADLRQKAARRYVARVTPPDAKAGFAEQLEASALRGLNLFAGAEPPSKGAASTAGLPAIQDFLVANVPEAERGRTSEVLVRILDGSLFELLNLTREQAGRPALKASEDTGRFMSHAVLSLSDSFAYPAPLFFTLKDFQQVQASVFQVTRAPGKTLVYLGCGLLALGVFMMLYVRERRLWIWLDGPADADRLGVTMALSFNRKMLDNDREFAAMRQAVLGTPPAAAVSKTDA